MTLESQEAIRSSLENQVSEQELKNKIHHRRKVKNDYVVYLKPMCRVGQKRFAVVSTENTEFILALLFLNYYINFHRNACKPPFPHPCIVCQL